MGKDMTMAGRWITPAPQAFAVKFLQTTKSRSISQEIGLIPGNHLIPASMYANHMRISPSLILQSMTITTDIDIKGLG
jgi:hypothetical protein